MTFLYRNVARATFPAIALLTVAACGGGDGTSTAPPPPPRATYSIGGTVSGLDAGQSIILQDNGGETKTISANGVFTFTTKVMSGGAYAVVVAGWPLYLNCTVTGGSGTASANVASVVVACANEPTYSVGGSVSGLIGKGLELELQTLSFDYDNYTAYFATVEIVGIDKNGDYNFATRLHSGAYRVAIQQPQSPAQRCAVKNNLDVIGTANVANVDIVCGEFAYVTNSTDKTISAFGIDATTGAMAAAGTVVTGGLSPYSTTSTPDKGHLYVANGGSNDVSVFAVDSGNGALTAVPGSPFAGGANPRALALYSALTGHNGPPTHVEWYLYIANVGSNDLSAYRVDKTTGVPTPLLPASYASGFGPSAIAIHPDGPFLYSANAGGSNDISAFQMDNNSGGLTPLAGSPFASGSSVSSLAFGAGGNFLYAADASGGAAAIYGFSVAPWGDPNGGALTGLAGFPHPLPSCTFIVADQTGTYLYATDGTDLLGYGIDANTGALTRSPASPLPWAPTCGL
jgi:6-phosphogluconolactonase (cycloisomerase 2 family)